MSAAPSASGPTRERQAYPITFKPHGRRGGSFTLFVDSSAARQVWQNRLRDAILVHAAGAKQAFTLATVSDQTFLKRASAPDPHTCDDVRPPVGAPTCSVTFDMPDGPRLIAIGHEEGLWIGLRHLPSSLTHVLRLPSITQCAVLAEFKLVLVLADMALYVYPLEALVPSGRGERGDLEPRKLSGSRDVSFFKTGKIRSRVLVVYAERSAQQQTVFQALEPIPIHERADPRDMVGRERPAWLRTYRVRMMRRIGCG